MSRKYKTLLTYQQVSAVLAYSQKTGAFRWKKTLGARAKKGRLAGFNPGSGEYQKIKIYGQRYKAQRLAWLLTYKVWPERDMDHINGDPSDNRICNLRQVTGSQNQANRKLDKNNTSGVTGVQKCGRGWSAFITLRGTKYSLGYSVDFAKACSYRFEAERKLFGEFSRRGRLDEAGKEVALRGEVAYLRQPHQSYSKKEVLHFLRTPLVAVGSNQKACV